MLKTSLLPTISSKINFGDLPIDHSEDCYFQEVSDMLGSKCCRTFRLKYKVGMYGKTGSIHLPEADDSTYFEEYDPNSAFYDGAS